jgi:colanic acid biosynthesis glycosyl transferase WcaI
MSKSSMSTRPNVVFIEQFYYPEGWGGAQIPRDITIEFARAGFQVSVYCGSDQYVSAGSECAISPARFGVAIKHIPRYALPHRFGRRMLAQIWFCVLTAASIILRPKPSVFVVQTNPPLMVVAASWIAAIFRKPLVIIAQDIYPEVMIAHGMIKRESIFGRMLTAVFRGAYRRAKCVVSLGPKMTARLIEKGVIESHTCEIANWATGDLTLIRGPTNEIVRDWGLSGKFVLLYSGNLGIAHDAQTMVRAVALVKPTIPNLRLVIVGAGSRIQEAQHLVEDLRLQEEVLFAPAVSPRLLPHTLGAADLALVTLLPEFNGLVVPSKLLGYMARGLPTLYVGPPDSDVGQIIASSGGGISVRNGDVLDFAARITNIANDRASLDRMGAMAAEYYRLNLRRDIGLSRYRQMLDAVLDEGEPS